MTSIVLPKTVMPNSSPSSSNTALIDSLQANETGRSH